MDDISPEELAELREAFRVFDQDGDGSITLTELRIVLDQMGLDPSEEELQDMINEVDEDQSGSISFVEFVDMVKKAVDTNKSSREELFRAFQVFDIDQNGFITMEELRTGISYSKEKKSLTPTEELASIYFRENHERRIFDLVVLQATGDRPTDEDALEMIAEADIDGDGRINYDEFVLIMTSNTASRK